MNKSILYTLALTVSFLSACGLPTDDEDTADGYTGSTPSGQASYNVYVANRNDAISGLDELDTTAVLADAPANDTARLEDTYAINSTESFGTALVGDMTMNVDFGAETVSGSLTNNFLDRDNTAESEVTELDGKVSFTGSLDLDPNGDFYDSTNTKTWQLEASGKGTLTDSATETVSSTQYRLDFDLYGNFYDTSGLGTIAGVGTIGDVAAGGLIEGNVDVTTDGDTVIYDITNSELYDEDGDSSGFLVYELED